MTAPGILECVVNVSEGRDPDRIAALATAAGGNLLDVHTDGDHHRSVLTLAGPAADVEAAARSLARAAVATIDISAHAGVHPRLGVLDVVPWTHLVADATGRLRDGSIQAATAARDRFVRWAADDLGLPAFAYGPATTSGHDRADGGEVTLPRLRREAWRSLRPVAGPGRPHPSAGAVCVGARPLLVAYNLWLCDPDPALARRVAAEVRTGAIRTLGLAVGAGAQVSCNLVDPWSAGPGAAYDAVADRAEIERAELVGLLPGGVLDAIPASRWDRLDVGASRTIEARLGRAGLDGGRFSC